MRGCDHSSSSNALIGNFVNLRIIDLKSGSVGTNFLNLVNFVTVPWLIYLQITIYSPFQRPSPAKL
jgi:hypothetical protein